jgi:hypothetical protein
LQETRQTDDVDELFAVDEADRIMSPSCLQ